MTRLLNAEHLRASYRTPDGREVTAVDDVSVYIDEGEVLGVAGESGCGKTTLGSIISLTARPPLYVDQRHPGNRRQGAGPRRQPPGRAVLARFGRVLLAAGRDERRQPDHANS